MQRAYALIETKSVDADQRVIEGIASTPTVDRQGDVVEPLGASFRLPLSLLWQHRHDEPIGHVEWAKATSEGIRFRARFVKVEDPGPLRDRLETAWQSVRSGLVRAVSIGFIPVEAEPMATGYRFKRWEWTELSVVTIPAQADATIENAKHFDQQVRGSGGAIGRVRLKNSLYDVLKEKALADIDFATFGPAVTKSIEDFWRRVESDERANMTVSLQQKHWWAIKQELANAHGLNMALRGIVEGLCERLEKLEARNAE